MSRFSGTAKHSMQPEPRPAHRQHRAVLAAHAFTRCVVKTGQRLFNHRQFRAKRRGFLDYLYFTDYETLDPVAYGAYGAQTSSWYEWSIRVLEARLAARRGDP